MLWNSPVTHYFYRYHCLQLLYSISCWQPLFFFFFLRAALFWFSAVCHCVYCKLWSDTCQEVNAVKCLMSPQVVYCLECTACVYTTWAQIPHVLFVLLQKPVERKVLKYLVLFLVLPNSPKWVNPLCSKNNDLTLHTTAQESLTTIPERLGCHTSLISTSFFLILCNFQVVMAVAQLYFHLAPKAEVGVIAKALVRLLRSHRWCDDIKLLFFKTEHHDTLSNMQCDLTNVFNFCKTSNFSIVCH